MKRVSLPLLAVLLLAPAVSFGQDELPDKINEAILEELKEIRGMLSELKKEVAELKLMLAEQAEEAEEAAAVPIWRGGQRPPNLEELNKIKLPEDPTEDQVREYIKQIMVASRNQNMFSSDDPQVTMLTEVGSKHVDLLLEALTGRFGRGFHNNNYYVMHAIRDLVTAEHKQLILEALPNQKELVDVVSQQGWIADARETLVKELAAQPRRLPTEWIKAVALLRDPKTYDDLKTYFVHGGNRAQTYEALRRIPDLDLADAVREAWGRAKYAESYEATAMAVIAVRYGAVDALEVLIDSLEAGLEGQPVFWDERRIRPAILRSIEFRGSDEETVAWFRKNQARLTFDPETTKYIVKGDQEEKE